jgi:hypothetical protein
VNGAAAARESRIDSLYPLSGCCASCARFLARADAKAAHPCMRNVMPLKEAA